jgi:hypothetical protein
VRVAQIPENIIHFFRIDVIIVVQFTEQIFGLRFHQNFRNRVHQQFKFQRQIIAIRLDDFIEKFQCGLENQIIQNQIQFFRQFLRIRFLTFDALFDVLDEPRLNPKHTQTEAGVFFDFVVFIVQIIFDNFFDFFFDVFVLTKFLVMRD